MNKPGPYRSLILKHTRDDLIKSCKILLLGVLGFTSPYIFSNYINSFRQTHWSLYLPSELDIPRVEWMVIFYVSAYILPLLTLFALSPRQHKGLIKAIFLSGLFGACIFLLLPTKLGYARDLDQIIYFKPVYELLWQIDLPYNLMPSMHVTMAHLMLMPIIYEKINPVWKFALSLWLLGIYLSIVLVHQHHMIDIVSGHILAEYCFRRFYKNQGYIGIEDQVEIEAAKNISDLAA